MKKLKTYLTINALFSALTGLFMVLFSNQLQSFLGFTNTMILPVIGVLLVGFGLFVYSVANKHLENKKLVNLISIMDAFWVLGSSMILVLGLFDLTIQGYKAIGIVAVWIAYLGYNQYRHNK